MLHTNQIHQQNSTRWQEPLQTIMSNTVKNPGPKIKKKWQQRKKSAAAGSVVNCVSEQQSITCHQNRAWEYTGGHMHGCSLLNVTDSPASLTAGANARTTAASSRLLIPPNGELSSPG